MKIIGLLTATLALSIPVEPLIADPPVRDPALQLAATSCTKIKEEFTGRRRICYYDCAGTTRAISIRAIEECPPSITWPRVELEGVE